MPPNPDRQAKLAARRLEMENDPKLREAQDAANDAVLNRRNPEVEAVKPRQMLPNYYAKGGPVGKVGTFGMKRSKPDFGAGGPMQNFKTWSK